MKQLGFKSRLILIAVTPALLAVILLTSFLLISRLSSLDVELQDRGRALARQVASGAEYGVFSGNMSMLGGLANAVLRERGVAAVIIRDVNGQPLVNVGLPNASAILDTPALQGGQFIAVVEPVLRGGGLEEDLLDLGGVSAEPSVRPPIPAREQAIGSVHILLSRSTLLDARKESIGVAFVVALSVLAIALLIGRYYSRRLAEQVAHIADGAAQMGAGYYRTRLRTEAETTEFAVLTESFNRMAEEIEAAQRDLQKKIEAATQELGAKKLEAERANVAKSRFLAAASHDLRQPLHALGLFADQLARQEHTGESRRLVERVCESTEALGSLLDALLDISRLDAGALQARPELMPLDTLFERLEREFGVLAEQKGLRLRVRPTRAWVESDPAMLERILLNLLSNAVRYTPRGGILVAARRRGPNWRIEVRDSGIGIAETDQKLVFAEFVQLGNPERDRNKGLGLGLSVVQRMAELLGHPFGVCSKPAVGSTFWVEAPAMFCAPSAPSEPDPAEAALSTATVLLVEDDPLVLDSMLGQFESWGCRVHCAGSTAEVLMQVGMLPEPPQLIVCDQRLRNGDEGAALVRLVREHYRHDVAAVILTGEVDPRLQQQAEALGVPILTKPVRAGKLRAMLRAHVSEA